MWDKSRDGWDSRAHVSTTQKMGWGHPDLAGPALDDRCGQPGIIANSEFCHANRAHAREAADRPVSTDWKQVACACAREAEGTSMSRSLESATATISTPERGKRCKGRFPDCRRVRDDFPRYPRLLIFLSPPRTQIEDRGGGGDPRTRVARRGPRSSLPQL